MRLVLSQLLSAPNYKFPMMRTDVFEFIHKALDGCASEKEVSRAD